MTTEREFNDVIATAPEHIRNDVYMKAWGNAWAAEVYYEYSSDEERWAVAIMTAEMIIDAPADYGL